MEPVQDRPLTLIETVEQINLDIFLITNITG
jgi:hypothetical protein